MSYDNMYTCKPITLSPEERRRWAFYLGSWIMIRWPAYWFLFLQDYRTVTSVIDRVEPVVRRLEEAATIGTLNAESVRQAERELNMAGLHTGIRWDAAKPRDFTIHIRFEDCLELIHDRGERVWHRDNGDPVERSWPRAGSDPSIGSTNR